MIVYIVKKESHIEGIYDSREKAIQLADALNDYEYNYCGADPHGPQYHIEEFEIK